MAIKSRLKLGTSGDDTLNGTDQGEIFFGFGGNDTIFAGGEMTMHSAAAATI